MCGASLEAPAAAAREERKVVTVLFTDLVGFTSRVEALDPEDVRAMLSPYYARLRTEIERHGGTVEKFIGDAVMAVFGAPVAHEDDAERAVRAALAIRDGVDDLRIRTAVNTGEALVALDARPNEGEAMVSGDVVNTAARLQAAAPIDGILVGEATYRATRDAIDYREAEPIAAKGKSQPVPVWEVVGARARFGLDLAERLRSPLIGRVRERTLLVDSLERARAEQSAQLVTLVGVPGIGKSRLIAELFQTAEADPDLISWRQGRCVPYGERVSYGALGEIVKAHAGILETDDADAAESKLVVLLAAVLDDEQERAWVAGHVRPLVGLEGADGTDRTEAFAAWRRLIEAAAEQRALVLVFEDLHWADDGLLDFVDYLVDWATNVPLLVIATARPELLDRRPGWGGGRRNAFTLSIGSLSREETAQLLASLLERPVLPAEVQEAVLQRAEGNPLYAEEYVRMLQDSDFEDLPLPDSVQGMIAARLDALPAAEKTLLQDAAVIGKVFWPGAIGNADERLLHALERKEFIRRDRRSAVAGETQYAFLHGLVRDVAYGQIPRAQRADRHRRAALWIEMLAQDRSDDRVEMLAHHYREALVLAEAAGVAASELRDPARAALTEAAERAAALNAWQSAAELAHEALALTPDDRRERPELLLLIANSKLVLALPGGDDAAVAARDAFLALDDRAGAAEAESLHSRLLWRHGDGAGAATAGRNSLALAEGLPLSVRVARAFAGEAGRCMLAGELDRAIELADRTRAMAEELGRPELEARAFVVRGTARIDAGDSGGLTDTQRALEIVSATNAAETIFTAHNNHAGVLWMLGRLDESTKEFERCRETCERLGFRQGIVWEIAVRGRDLMTRGDFDGALASVEQYFELIGDAPHYMIGPSLALRAEMMLARGAIEAAAAEAQRSLDYARQSGDPQLLGPAVCIASRTSRAVGRTEEADGLLTESLAAEQTVDFVWSLAFVLGELMRGEEYLAAAPAREGFVWREAGRMVAAGEYVRAAQTYERMGAAYPEAWARLLAAEAGDTSQLDRAHTLFTRMGAASYLERCQSLLKASA
jgi:class 3 adenylate cyclase/tetratricopeptide (TPR) repeat protein